MRTETERQAYLDALGIDAWTLRIDGRAEPENDTASETGGAVDDLDWAELRQRVSACTQCALHNTRTQTVFGVGDETAEFMVIGEAPGAEEDRRGEPFVGRAGKLLDEMLRAIGLARDRVFIANILKCRPPGNRDPLANEAAECRKYLERQIALVAPKIILAVGRVAAQQLLGTDAPLGRLRGRKHYLDDGQLPVIVTYHPAYLLRSPSQKGKAWQDLRMARAFLGQEC